ncbi:hypothetical protein WJX84_002042 [Apatococcus fuscideae]|uniref:NADPH oxidase n=1 Tax=Apatococcus fuscideae TaxID=2026836 RepID=A0AAW1TCC0_9CHLO
MDSDYAAQGSGNGRHSRHPKPLPSPWLSQPLSSVPRVVPPHSTHDASSPQLPRFPESHTQDSNIRSVGSKLQSSPLARLRADLEERASCTGGLPRQTSHTYHDLQQGLQTLSTLGEEVGTRALARAPSSLPANLGTLRLPTKRSSRPAVGSQSEPAGVGTFIIKRLQSIQSIVQPSKVMSGTRAAELEAFEAEKIALLKEFRKHEGKKGYVSDEELVTAILTLHRDSLENRIAFTFELLDVDMKGALSRSALVSMLKASCSESRISVDDTVAEKLAETFFTHLKKGPHETISKDEFVSLLQDDENLQQSIKLAGVTLKPKASCSDEVEEIKRQTASLARIEKIFVRLYLCFRISHPAKVFWLTIFCLAQVAGFVVAFRMNDFDIKFKALGWAYPIAKASAGAIQVVVALLLFPVARGMLTFIRSTPLKRVIPVDESIRMHKFLAYCFLFWGWLHSLAHFVNSAHATQPGHLRGVYNKLTQHYTTTCMKNSTQADMWARSDLKVAQAPLYPAPSLQPVVGLGDYYAREVQVTGVLLLGIISIGYLWAMKYPRQLKFVKGTVLNRIFNNFTWFYISHLFMTTTVVVLLIIHPWPGVGQLGPAKLNCGGPVQSTTTDPSRATNHGVTWMYLVAGVLAFGIERLIRTWRRAAWDVSLSAVKLHAGNIIELRLTNPRRTAAHMARKFNFKPGQYGFLNVPKLSKLEWHPFSITSSPFDDHISFHIEAKGDWTMALQALMRELTGQDAMWTRLGQQLSYQVTEPDVLIAAKSSLGDIEMGDVNPFEEQLALGARATILESQTSQLMLEEKLEEESPDLEAGTPPTYAQGPTRTRAPKISLDGPYGAPAQNYNDYEVLLLVGAGVGITPFASVLRTLVKEYEMAKCTRCGLMNERLFVPKKVYFYWITREQQAPTWFQSTLEAIQSNEEYAKFLDIHVHFSSALAANDLRASIVKVAQNLCHKENGFDVLSGCGMSFPISFGRPDWDTIFADISRKHPGQLVGTFYCGGSVLGKQLKGLCRTWNKAGAPERRSIKLKDGSRANYSDNHIAHASPVIRAARFDFFKESF